ncbi:hypothetical protein [Candidatus Methanocrinis natronophilus]|uniref:Uncharacterized protein n=1 Tax=Candidatus Methanocrinis natronophilus TaxID=3033396 RepID=A0ABT5X892_9EURY|nr:hypothetical protein [Candidatus Methanocrinis natronophilus]MDF0590802.1 hypothetical protein [Candidatus Methanocrinis natronophilus]
MEGLQKAVAIDGFRGSHPSFEEILALDEVIRRRADRIGELLLVEVWRTGPAGMDCERIEREDPIPFRVDDRPWEAVSWHLTITYGGPAGDALGSRGRWSQTGETAAECVLDPLGLFEALASGRLSRFFSELARWLEAEVRPRGLATEDRIGEAAWMAMDLARLLEGWRDGEERGGHDEMVGLRDGGVTR